MRRIAWMSILILVVGLTPAMADTWWSWTFADTTGVVASGTLDSIANGDGTYTATSGPISVTAGFLFSGNLWANPLSPNNTYSPSGQFIIDNQLRPLDSAVLDTYGLLWTDASGAEVNIWGNGAATNYTVYEWVPPSVAGDGTMLPGGYAVAHDGNGVFTLAHVPEGGTVSLLFAMLAGAGGLAGVLKRKLT
jgi:hypothetical protein